MAAHCCAAAPHSALVLAGRAPTPEEDARAANSLVKEGRFGKAPGRAMPRDWAKITKNERGRERERVSKKTNTPTPTVHEPQHWHYEDEFGNASRWGLNWWQGGLEATQATDGMWQRKCQCVTSALLVRYQCVTSALPSALLNFSSRNCKAEGACIFLESLPEKTLLIARQARYEDFALSRE